MAAAEGTLEVVLADPIPRVRHARIVPGDTVLTAITRSGILEECPDIDLHRQRVGIFGQFVSLSTPLSGHERVEIYRPLPEDPKEARRKRATARRRRVRQGRLR